MTKPVLFYIIFLKKWQFFIRRVTIRPYIHVSARSTDAGLLALCFRSATSLPLSGAAQEGPTLSPLPVARWRTRLPHVALWVHQPSSSSPCGPLPRPRWHPWHPGAVLALAHHVHRDRGRPAVRAGHDQQFLYLYECFLLYIYMSAFCFIFIGVLSALYLYECFVLWCVKCCKFLVTC